MLTVYSEAVTCLPVISNYGRKHEIDRDPLAASVVHKIQAIDAGQCSLTYFSNHFTALLFN